MVELYNKIYNIPHWGKIYLNLISSNSGSDTLSIKVLENKKDLKFLYEPTNIADAESFIEGFLECLTRFNKEIPCPSISERKKGWSNMYVKK